MTSLETWQYLIGAVGALFVIPLAQQPRFSPPLRAAITVVYCLVAAFGAEWYTGGFAGGHDVQHMVDAFVRVFLGAITTYYGLGKPTGLSRAIERSTSPGVNVR